MFRVPQNTVLRRVAVATLIVLSGTSLTACGSSDEEAPKAASTSVEPAPTSTTAGAKIGPSATHEGPEVVKKASKKKISPAKVASDVDKATAALSAAGFPKPTVSTSGPSLTTVLVTPGAVIFFDSERAAAESAAQYVKVIESRPGFSRVARTGSRVYIMSTKERLTDDQRLRLAKIRKVVDAAL